MIHVRMKTEQPAYYAISLPVWVRLQGNGTVVRCGEGDRPGGILSPDGSEIWQLAGRESLGEGYPIAEEVTQAEYEQWLAEQEAGSAPEVPDPEDTEPEIPEGVDPVTVLTRAELTVKVTELDEALQLLLSGVTEDA